MTAVEDAEEVDWRTLLPSELRSLRAEARKAGYVSPFPARGKAPKTTIDDRCAGCNRTLFVTFRGELKCPYPRCAQHGIIETLQEES